MRQNGLTLIELVVVIAIIGILAVVAGFEFTGWMARYRVESQIKEMYADLMSERVRAMQRNIQYVAEMANNQYVICEDTNGNNICDNPAETANSSISQALSKFNLRYQLNWGFSGGASRIVMDRRGIAAQNGSIWLVQPDGTIWGPADVDYDCIVISNTRINLGKYDGANCQAK